MAEQPPRICLNTSSVCWVGESLSERRPIGAGQRQRECFVYEDHGATLVVTPFFGGRYGLNGDDHLIALARLIAEYRFASL